MTNPEIADAIREVTGKMLNAIKDGYRSRQIDADDLVEVLLSIADRLDPPLGGGAEPRPSVLDAARALLEARENQMVTQVEWDQLREAVERNSGGRS
jgi:hypothetical protein